MEGKAGSNEPALRENVYSGDPAKAAVHDIQDKAASRKAGLAFYPPKKSRN